MCADDEEGLLTVRTNQTNRLPGAEDIVQPLQRMLRAVGNVGAADEAFEQTYPRCEDFFFLADGAFDGDTQMGQIAVGSPPVAPNRAS